MSRLTAALRGLRDRAAGPAGTAADRIVPPTGFTAQLTLFSAGAMAFLAVFALALALATGRLAERWSEGLAQSVTIRVTSPPAEREATLERLTTLLAQTPGAGAPRILDDAALADLLAPWFGPDVPVDALPVPRLVEVPVGAGFDAAGLRLRLEGEIPGTVLDDHTEWRQPLVAAAGRLSWLGLGALALIAATGAAMIALAAKASLAANGPVIRVLRLVGARDATIAGAFIRRYTRRAAAGAALGTVAGLAALAILPDMDAAGGFLTGLGLQGRGWLAALTIPAVAAGIGYGATRWAAGRMLGQVR